MLALIIAISVPQLFIAKLFLKPRIPMFQARSSHLTRNPIPSQLQLLLPLIEFRLFTDAILKRGSKLPFLTHTIRARINARITSANIEMLHRTPASTIMGHIRVCSTQSVAPADYGTHLGVLFATVSFLDLGHAVEGVFAVEILERAFTLPIFAPAEEDDEADGDQAENGDAAEDAADYAADRGAVVFVLVVGVWGGRSRSGSHGGRGLGHSSGS